MSKNFEQYHLKEQQRPGFENFSVEGGRTVLKDGSFESPNFKTGEKGWKVNSEGEAEFQGAKLSGSLDVGGSDATSFHVDEDGNMWLGAAAFADAPFNVSNAGILGSAAYAIQTTVFNVSNGAVDEVVFSKTVTAGLFRTNGGVRIIVTGKAPINTSEATTTIDVNFGGTTFYVSPNLSRNPQKDFKIEVHIFNRNATNSQIS